jgi:uncharacterized protein YrrD
MKPSRKFISLPIISLQEGQQIGYVKGLILNAAKKSVAAIIVDPKGFFKDQRIIPYSRVISVGEDAITIDKESHVEKTSNIPELLDLTKEKLSIIGTKMITATGKTLGTAEEYYIDPTTGDITQIELSGGKLEGFFNGKALISAKYITTIGHDVIITQKDSETTLTVAEKGLTDTFKNLLHSASHLASETTHTLSGHLLKDKTKTVAHNTLDVTQTAETETETVPRDEATVSEISCAKEPLGK